MKSRSCSRTSRRSASLRKANEKARMSIWLWDEQLRADTVRTFHLQENERSIDPECERHGRQGKKAIWQKVNPQPCQSLIRSMNSWVSLIPMTWASTGSECPKRLLT